METNKKQVWKIVILIITRILLMITLKIMINEVFNTSNL